MILRHMLKKIPYACIIALLIHTPAHAIPQDAKKALKDAFETGNPLVIEAVVEMMGARYPDKAEDIVLHLTALEQHKKQEQEAKALKLAEDKEGTSYDGEVELGITYAFGNSESEQSFARTELTRDAEHWRNIFTAEMRNSAEADTRTAEDYRARFKTDYKLSDIDYLYGSISYVNDRFSGFEYRIEEFLGYGRTLWKDDTIELTAEVGLGARHSHLETTGATHEFTQRLKQGLNWQIDENWKFEESLETTIGREATITNLQTALTTALAQSLNLRFRFDVEHISDVPAGRENTDTVTGLNLVYGF